MDNEEIAAVLAAALVKGRDDIAPEEAVGIYSKCYDRLEEFQKARVEKRRQERTGRPRPDTAIMEERKAPTEAGASSIGYLRR